MQLKSKSYKLCKIKHYIKKKNILLIYLTNDVKTKPFLKLKQNNKKKKLITYKPNKTLLKKFLNTTTLSNLNPVATGSYLFVTFNDKTKINNPFNKFFELNKTTNFLSLKLNNKIYTKSQLADLQTLSYKNNIKLLHGCLNKTLKSFPLKFKK